MNSPIFSSTLAAVATLVGTLGLLYALSLMVKSRRRQPDVDVGTAGSAPLVEPSVSSQQPAPGVSPQLVAIIATALAAYLGTAAENLNIVSIRRTRASSWLLAARRDGLQS
ncbi:MAG: hypothetical protein ACOX18_01690 [Bacillota bacterium]|jgi:hypothetical protein